VDGIKPTIADLNDDNTPVFDAPKVDLLHPSGPLTTEPTVAVPQPSRVAPITPPFHGKPESNVEYVKNTPPPASEPLPVIPERKPDPVPAAAAIHDTAPAAPVVVSDPVKAAPVSAPAKSGRGRGLLIGLIILIVLVGAGAAYYFLVYSKKTPVQAPAVLPVTAGTPSSLDQFTSKGTTFTTGSTTNTPPTLGASLVTTANSGTVSLEVEVEPLATAFTGTPTTTGAAVTANGNTLHLTATPTKLADGSYHWQARTLVGTSTSAWVSNSLPSSTGPDFIISTVAPAVPTVTAVAGGTITGTTLTTSQNQALITGKTVAGSTVAIVVTPDNITLTPTVAADGTWTVTPSQSLANGSHTLAITTTDAAGNKSQASYTLAINPVVATTTPTAPVVTTPAATTPTTPVTTKLAPTGDPTQTLSLIALLVGLASVIGLVYLRRFDRHERG